MRRLLDAAEDDAELQVQHILTAGELEAVRARREERRRQRWLDELAAARDREQEEARRAEADRVLLAEGLALHRELAPLVASRATRRRIAKMTKRDPKGLDLLRSNTERDR